MIISGASGDVTKGTQLLVVQLLRPCFNVNINMTIVTSNTFSGNMNCVIISQENLFWRNLFSDRQCPLISQRPSFCFENPKYISLYLSFILEFAMNSSGCWQNQLFIHTPLNAGVPLHHIIQILMKVEWIESPFDQFQIPLYLTLVIFKSICVPFEIVPSFGCPF